mgnify:CR=1 FL=1
MPCRAVEHQFGEDIAFFIAKNIRSNVRELEGAFDDVALNGILLISAILDFSIVDTAPGNELPHAIHLPTMAATAALFDVSRDVAERFRAVEPWWRHIKSGEYRDYYRKQYG